jgi:hypothetical protein
MTEPQKIGATVNVKPFGGHPHTLHMIWHRRPGKADVVRAFDALKQALDASETVLDVVVDVSAQPHFPLTATIYGALNIQRHPKMGLWLVIGAAHMARFIGRTITGSGRDNIEWFNDESDVLERLRQRTVERMTGQ